LKGGKLSKETRRTVKWIDGTEKSLEKAKEGEEA
jgi:hypothetical protein